jgi:hypothetical protein
MLNAKFALLLKIQGGTLPRQQHRYVQVEATAKIVVPPFDADKNTFPTLAA